MVIGNLAMTGNWTTLESGGTGFTFVYGEKAAVLNTQAAQGGNRVELAGLNENAFIDNINLGISNDTNYSAHFTKTTDGNYVIFTDTYLPTQDFTTINATATQSTSKPNSITPKEFCCLVCSLTSKLSKNPAEILCSSVPEDQEKQFTGKLEGRFSTVKDFANAIKTIGEVKRVIDNTEYINESLAEILDTFKKALMLVIIIVFIFLQSWRATLIPVLAIPASPWHFWTG